MYVAVFHEKIDSFIAKTFMEKYELALLVRAPRHPVHEEDLEEIFMLTEGTGLGFRHDDIIVVKDTKRDTDILDLMLLPNGRMFQILAMDFEEVTEACDGLDKIKEQIEQILKDHKKL